MRLRALSQELPHPVEERGGQRPTLALQRRIERFERLALLGRQLLRDLEDDAIAGVAAPAVSQAGHALAGETQDLVRLGAGGNRERRGAVQNRYLQLCAERQLRERDRQVAVEVVVLPAERLVLGQTHEHIEIAGRAAVEPGRSLARETELHAVVDAGRDLDLKHVLGAPAAFAAALATERAEHAFAVTFRTRARDGQEAVAHPDLAAALTRLARLRSRAGLVARASADLARLESGNPDLGLDAGGRVLQRQLQLVLEIFATRRARPTSAARAATEEVVEDILEEAAEAAGVEADATGYRAEPVVLRSLVGIRQDRVRLAGLLEAVLGVLVPRIAVGMVLHRQLTGGLLDLGGARRARDAADLVVVRAAP